MPPTRDNEDRGSRRSLSPSSPTSQSSSRGGQRGSRSPEANKEDAAEAVDPEQKNKKRIQNRVAQRTYRNRMKQRVQDLERQLCEMRTRQQQQYFTRDYSVPDGHIPFHASAGNLPPQLWQQEPTTYPMSPDIWPPILSQTPHYQAHDGTAMAASALMSHSFPPQPSYNDSTLMNNMQALGSASQSPNVVLQSDIELQHSSPMRLYTEEPTVGFTSSEQAHFSPRKHQSAAESGKSVEKPEEESQRMGSSHLSASWENSPPVLSPESSRAGTLPQHTTSPWGSIATAPTEISEDSGVPAQSSSVEDRFEYVLECARRVGFDTFDNMAAQYYASSFEPSSSLARDQRVSRNRHLPALISEIQEKSAEWSAWERRGYQDETLKIAESICALECREFRSWHANLVDPGAVSLATVQQKLPNTWALLTSLSSVTPLQRPGDRSNLVFSGIKQLCALSDVSSHGFLDA